MNFIDNKTNNYIVGIYIRISKEDDGKKYESESITNQKSLLLQYVRENNLTLYDIYIDDGYTGTNFDRPGFIRLINDIESKNINMVITKDMSRLGRDYIKTGELVEKYFPEHRIRYIAVTDNIDTYLDNSNNDIAPFKAIMNDMYAKDISKKIKTSLRAKQKEGKWVGGRTPFGYDIDPKNKNHLIINERQAIVVRRIYNMCLKGLSFYKIAKKLTLERIKTPSEYYSPNYYMKLKYAWHSKTIRDILTNEMYTGNMVQNKRSKVNYKIKKVVKNNPKDFIVVNDTHEAIINSYIFDEVQKRIPKNVGRHEKKENHLLDGILYCGDCGHRISITPRRKVDNKCYTICNYYRTYIKQGLCTTHSNNYEQLEKEIINHLIQECLINIDKKAIKERVLKSINIYGNNYQKEINILKTDIDNIYNNLDNIYIDKLKNVIDENMFKRIKDKLEGELSTKEKRYEELLSTKEKFKDSKPNKLEKYIKNFLSMKKLEREFIINLIDGIYIFNDKTINISLSFQEKLG